jgi:hypothetical protein
MTPVNIRVRITSTGSVGLASTMAGRLAVICSDTLRKARMT